MRKHAIFLSGPIGVGKTTIGRALAARLGGAFVDGDDHAEPGRPWYSSILRTSASIVATGLQLLETRTFLVVAYPLGCTTWIYHRRKFSDAGVSPIFVTLRASYESIIAPARGREFSAAERERIKVMLSEGYADRAFSDLTIDTDQVPVATIAAKLVDAIRPLIASSPGLTLG